MAGHSKWANIQHRKGAQDARRGKLFTKLIREITTSARLGGSDPATNPRLRTAMDKALAANMTRDTIDRAAKRGAGELDGVSYEDVRYEGYGPGGVAVMVDCMTDNRNRTVADVRHAFSKHGGNLGSDGSVGYLFSHSGVVLLPATADGDRLMEVALEAGAEDIVENADGSYEVLTTPEEFETVRDAIKAVGLEVEHSEVTMRASTAVSLGAEAAADMLRLLEALEDHDDVQEVYSNADIPDEVLERL